MRFVPPLAALGLAFTICFICGCRPQNLGPMTFLNNHNKYRVMLREGRVLGQPAAKSLQNLTWSSQLEDDAKTWAMNCQFTHATVGENLAMSTGINQDPVKMWFDEHEQYKFGPISMEKVAQTGHYTQLIWEDTRELGCYRHLCDGVPLSGGQRMKNAYYTVCRYSPPGNYVGQEPYEVSLGRREGSNCSEIRQASRSPGCYEAIQSKRHRIRMKNGSAVTPFPCLTCMPSVGNTRAGILPGRSNIDKSWDAEDRFEPRTVRSVNSHSNH
ncbi:hypothetical protein T265_09240 [Opisthorchis viverrini]|uniref:SCP domain-containing protein n=1 Tax=Opisthorchis viverrini TaxID=6198 RepID=A0A074Z6E7_OPIVI|nr:hypothetical protein T265_09240 [Opisthorchis viverrini]KER22721.1 hypothetical protein T265_09240 [Opisthorchis viverrini]